MCLKEKRNMGTAELIKMASQKTYLSITKFYRQINHFAPNYNNAN